jgi:hypothetical protein
MWWVVLFVVVLGERVWVFVFVWFCLVFVGVLCGLGGRGGGWVVVFWVGGFLFCVVLGVGVGCWVCWLLLVLVVCFGVVFDVGLVCFCACVCFFVFIL